MTRNVFSIIMASLLAGPASLASLLDLPDPSQIEPDNSTYSRPGRYEPPAQRQSISAVVLENISRKNGGESFIVSISPARRLIRIEATAQQANVKIHRTKLKTASGRIVSVRELQSTLTIGGSAFSENLNLSEDISEIEITAESMGGNASLKLEALADSGVSLLSYTRASSPIPEEPPKEYPSPGIGRIREVNPRSEKSCAIEGRSGSSYIAMNGSRVSEYGTLSSSLGLLKALVQGGTCRLSISTCGIAASSGKAYVTIDGSRATNYVDVLSAAAELRALQEAGVCQTQQSQCGISATGGVTYVTLNGGRVTDYGTLRDSFATLDLMVRTRLCISQSAYVTMEATGGNVYLTLDGGRATEYKNAYDVIRDLQQVRRYGHLFSAVSATCSIAATGGRVYANINGGRAMEYGDLQSGISVVGALAATGFCSVIPVTCDFSTTSVGSYANIDGGRASSYVSASQAISLVRMATQSGICR